jgi:hypothetical protein
VIVSVAAYIYKQKGIVKNIPEMDIYLGKPTNTNSYIAYNERVYKLDVPFTNTRKKKLLVVGNSYARDFVNMLVENNYTDSFEISFKAKFNTPETKQRITQAEFVIIGCPIDSLYLNKFCKANNLDKSKILIVGTKNFGSNISWIFNTTTPNTRCKVRVALESNCIPANNWYKLQQPNRYVDIIGLLIDQNNQVPAFTPQCKLISQDCKHLTKYGAQYLGSLLRKDSVFKHFITHLSQYNIHDK